MLKAGGKDCFVCKVMRGLAFGGLGGGIGGFGALWLGFSKEDAITAAIVGALIVTVLATQKRMKA